MLGVHLEFFRAESDSGVFFVVDSSRKEIVAGATATFLDFQLRNTKVVLIAVFQVIRIRFYYRYYCCNI